MRITQVVITREREVSLQHLDLNSENLAENELLIETERSFISAGTELANYTATDPAVHRRGSWCSYPWKPGYANVGMVLEAGAAHRNLIGRRVYTHGAHASTHRYATNARTKLIAPVPDGLSSDEAVATRMAMVAMAGLDASKPQYIRWVVVIGLGMVGNLAAQLFRLTGAQVIGVDPSERRRQMARECGIDHVVFGTEEEIAEQIRSLTGNRGADVTVDAVGHSSVALQAVRLAADGGEVIVLGTPRTKVSGDLTEIFATAHLRWVTIKGVLEWNIPTEGLLPQDYSQRKKLDALFRWIGEGRLNLKPMLTHRLLPEEIKAAYEGLLHKKEEYVGVILKWKDHCMKNQ